MVCCFSKEEVPTEKLLVLYYPPTMVHHKWDRSVYAAARAREALKEVIVRLESAYWRDVVGRKFAIGLLAAVLGIALLAWWVHTVLTAWPEAGFLRRYIQLLTAIFLLLVAHLRLRAFLRRSRLWKSAGRATIELELQAIRNEVKQMPADPTAEQAAVVLRRQCPEVISEIAFDGSYFRAFTYMDFVMYPQLKHPMAPEELPDKHSLSRDAYYVGDVVYDGWRMFQKGQRELIDPRFVGSGGRRGVI